MAQLSGFTVRDRLAWEVTPELYRAIRELWKHHSLAEDRRDLQGLLDTLTKDCVYEVVPTGERWEGHAGARTFYTSFLGAFPDVRFDLKEIVIGPQGVIEVTRMRGTHQGPWSSHAPTGQRVDIDVVISFPWDPAAERFSGERVYYDTARMSQQLGRDRT